MRRHVTLAVLALALGSAPPVGAQYAFTPVLLSGSVWDPFGFGRPALNANGSVAFTVAAADFSGTTLFRWDAGTLTPIASTAAMFDRFGDVSLNDAGQIGFEGSFSDIRGEGIFRADGTAITTIAGTRNAGVFDFVNAGPSLNNVGTVAFIGETEVSFVDGVFAGNGGPVVPLYTDAGPVENFNGNPSLNDLGYVAFAGSAGDNQGIFLGNGGPLTTLADKTDGTFAFFGQPSLNERNMVAFFAGTNDFTASGIFLADATGVTPILQGDFTQFSSFGSDPSLNNLGQVAYVVEPTFGDQILVIGPDPVAGRVVGTGDTLFGQLVTGVVLWREGLNDAGQVAFTAFFADGSAGVFIATPSTVPEPATLLLVAGGLVALLLRQRRRTA